MMEFPSGIINQAETPAAPAELQEGRHDADDEDEQCMPQRSWSTPIRPRVIL
jgi:hypothetical protein